MGLYEQVKNCRSQNSVEHAIAVVNVLKDYIKNSQWESSRNLLAILDPEVSKIQEAEDVHFISKNMTARVLKIVRDEYASLVAESVYLTASDPMAALYELASWIDKDHKAPAIQEAISNGLEELLQELGASVTSIAAQAGNYISPEETIMTFGYSRTVMAFLKAAHKIHPIRVVAVKDYKEDCFKTREELQAAGIDTTVLYHNSIFNMMPTMTKVVMGAHKVITCGSTKQLHGVTEIVQSAEHFKKDIIICTGAHKITIESFLKATQEPNNDDPVKRLGPERIARLKTLPLHPKLVLPIYDYIRPNNIKLFIFNSGPVIPDKVASLKNQLYFEQKGIPTGHPRESQLVFTRP